MKIFNQVFALIAAFVMCAGFAACGNTADKSSVWTTAAYTEDAEFGNGAKTIAVEVEAEERSVTFTLNTDKKTVGEALEEHGLISGEEGAYGLYVKVVNGITADYDDNQSYWSFCRNGEYMQTGVDVTEVSDGEHYELIYTK